MIRPASGVDVVDSATYPIHLGDAPMRRASSAGGSIESAYRHLCRQ